MTDVLTGTSSGTSALFDGLTPISCPTTTNLAKLQRTLPVLFVVSRPERFGV
jgi:hypothetical protein